MDDRAFSISVACALSDEPETERAPRTIRRGVIEHHPLEAAAPAVPIAAAHRPTHGAVLNQEVHPRGQEHAERDQRDGPTRCPLEGPWGAYDSISATILFTWIVVVSRNGTTGLGTSRRIRGNSVPPRMIPST